MGITRCDIKQSGQLTFDNQNYSLEQRFQCLVLYYNSNDTKWVNVMNEHHLETSPADSEKAHVTLRALLPELKEKYGVQSLWLFGSRQRGTARPDSDLDILVEFDERSLSLFKFIE